MNLIDDWAFQQLQSLNTFYSNQDLQDITQHALKLQKNEIKPYFTSILEPSHKLDSFIQSFIEKKFPKSTSSWVNPSQILQDALELSEDEIKQIIEHGKQLESKQQLEYFTDFVGKESAMAIVKSFKSFGRNNPSKPAVVKQEKQEKKEKKTKTKEKVGSAPDMNGKPVCECMATVHPLVTNCKSCGKIICEYEKECQCNSPIYTTMATEKAKANLERLVDYDKNSTQRTHVVDLKSDYDMYAGINDKWKDEQEKAIIKTKIAREESKKEKRVISLSIGKSVSVSHKVEYEYTDNEIETVKARDTDSVEGASERVFKNPYLKNKPVFVSVEPKKYKILDYGDYDF
ncbi:hypothetical protein HDV04_001343 [Boothiomyces sp. JEL0838]|nr:hypothetical protein HDV04_001343 [Boothiomyces sp. JEL0838]